MPRAARGPETPAEARASARDGVDKRTRAVAVLDALGIKSRHPAAIDNAAAWGAFIEKTAKGCDARVACAVAGIGESTWYKWKKLGSEHFEVVDGVRTRVFPVEPFDELVAVWRRADGMARAKAQEGMLSAAEKGDTTAADRYLWRKEAQAEARIRSETATARLELLRIEAERQRVVLEQERLKLQRMREGGPDSTIGAMHSVVVLPALNVSPGHAQIIGTVDGTDPPALPEGSQASADTAAAEVDPLAPFTIELPTLPPR